MSRPVVHLYTVCWDEADMLGFFFRHYDPWVDRYVVYDDGSTDGSLEILRAHPRVELRRFARVETESFVLSHKAMQDEAWKESRGAADWVVVTAIDEHLHVAGRAMADYLAGPEAARATLLPALGFDMNHPEMLDDAGLLVRRVTRGRARSAFNKLSIFRPDAIRETGFGPGRHAADPVGDLRLPPRDAVMLWHYKHLGFERNAAREAAQGRRLGAVDVANDYGQHYRWSKARLRAFWDEMEREAADLGAPDFEPERACIRPLWWEERPGILRRPLRQPLRQPLPRPAAAPRSEPAVSVLIKAYNHAPYVRQAIESVLDQPFQDFEIVVTDDGSTDGTREILQGYADPRIAFEALPVNQGISAAMNATVRRARGRYLAILNSDDFLLPGRLERQCAYLDAHPGVSLVFGLPRAVDEDGLPTEPFNDFTAPLGWPDQSRRTWLRQFFFNGNCLCAPTAMIRREAYADAGPYDPRLTNLQDLDMWIRMLVCGHDIRVLPEETTAFRIRANHANMSAPRTDTYLRSAFESTKILRRFADFTPDLFEEVFGEADQASGSAGKPVSLRIAELSAGIPRIDHRHLAVDLFHTHAEGIGDLRRLRDHAGALDAFNIRAVEDRDRALAEVEAESAARAAHLVQATADLAAARAEIALLAAEGRGLHARVASLSGQCRTAESETRRLHDERTALAASMRDLESHLAAVSASRERMRNSLSWRSTAFLRWIGRTTKRLRS